MLPLIDLLIKKYIEEGLERLRKNPKKLRQYFSHASDETIKSMEKLITEYKINVLSGYPRTQVELPCFVVTIAGEDEVPYGIGDGVDELYPEWLEGNTNYLHWEESGSEYVRENAQMKGQVRVEVWSDNATITSFLYAIAKYCLFAAKRDMVQERIHIPTVSGGDLEPVPDYMTIFVYRRAVILNFEYELSYHVLDREIGKEEGHFKLNTNVGDIDINPKYLSSKEEEVGD